MIKDGDFWDGLFTLQVKSDSFIIHRNFLKPDYVWLENNDFDWAASASQIAWGDFVLPYPSKNFTLGFESAVASIYLQKD